MHSGIIACSADDIKEVNQRKEYTLISTQLLKCLFADPNLNPQAVKCWQLLFNLARFDHNLEITLSYNRIAIELNRSKRTVIRYMQTLIKNGYIEVISNFDSELGKKPNTILIRVPSLIMDKVKSSKDRGLIQEQKSTFEVLNKISTSFDTESALTQKDNGCPIEQPTQVNYSQITTILSDRRGDPIDQEKSNNHEMLAMTKVSKNRSVPKMSLAPSDTPDITNNNIYINNNNNTPVVVDLKITQECTSPNKPAEPEATLIEQPSFETQITQLNFKKQKLEALDKQEGLKLSELSGNTVAIYEHLKYLGHIRSQIDTIEKEIAKLQKTVVITQEKQTKENNLTTQIDHMLKKPGERVIHIFTFNRLLKALTLMGYDDQKLTWIINEIVFEVRFGSLVKSAATGEVLSTDHAVNIALKLVRENRWTTPTLFKKSEGLQ